MHLYIFVVDPFADRGPDMYVRLSPGFRVAIILPFQFGEDLMFNFSFDIFFTSFMFLAVSLFVL